MDAQTVFPEQVLTEELSEPEVKLDGRKVLFDKKVSLLPVTLKKDGRTRKSKR